MAAGLAALGYAFIPGQSGNPSDWVLRQTADNSQGSAPSPTALSPPAGAAAPC